MTSNPFKYGNVPVKAEGEPVWGEKPTRSPEEEIAMLNEQVKKLYRYRAIYKRLAQIAKEGNLMFSTTHHGFVLVEDLETFMGERL